MGKECFTCKNKISIELMPEERAEMKAKNIANGERFKRVPEMIFQCAVTEKLISQVDPACEHYVDDETMVFIRKEISKTAKKLRNELK